MLLEPSYTLGEIIINALIWLGSAVSALIVALLTFLLKKYIDNFAEVQSTLKTSLNNLETSMTILRENNLTLNAQFIHLENNVKNGFNGHGQLLKDIECLEKSVIDLEKENIKIINRLENGNV